MLPPERHSKPLTSIAEENAKRLSDAGGPKLWKEMRSRDPTGTMRAERGLLHGYWLLSGYELRAVAMAGTIVLLMGLGLPKDDPSQEATGRVPAGGGTEHPLPHRQPRRAVAEGGDHAGQLVAGDRRCLVTAGSIGPGRWPLHLVAAMLMLRFVSAEVDRSPAP